MKKIIKKYFYFIFLIYKRVNNCNRTFSQSGEDLILNSFLKKRNGFYIDVGANHPFLLNNTYLFYKRGWMGINIEPNPKGIKLFKILRRRDININLGVGERQGNIPFYIFKEDVLSTFSYDESVRYQKMGHKIAKIKNIEVKPLSKIIDDNLPHKQSIDFMSIDTEGFDMQVLNSNNWEKYRPRFIILETIEYRNDGEGKKLNSVYDQYMSNIGYTKIADTIINTIYSDNKYQNSIN